MFFFVGKRMLFTSSEGNPNLHIHHSSFGSKCLRRKMFHYEAGRKLSTWNSLSLTPLPPDSLKRRYARKVRLAHKRTVYKKEGWPLTHIIYWSLDLLKKIGINEIWINKSLFQRKLCSTSPLCHTVYCLSLWKCHYYFCNNRSLTKQ